MTVQGTVHVQCPGCGREHDVKLVQSLNTRVNPDLKQRLLAGELNLLACPCGKRTQLAATLLYHDPDRDYFCQACPGGEEAMRQGEVAFQVIGSLGTRRLVPSQNALLEKVKILEADLDDRVVEVLKVLLLASVPHDPAANPLDSVLLFERVDRAAEGGGVIAWYLPDRAQHLTSPLPAYDKLAATLLAADDLGSDLRIDRAWAIDAARRMITNTN